MRPLSLCRTQPEMTKQQGCFAKQRQNTYVLKGVALYRNKNISLLCLTFFLKKTPPRPDLSESLWHTQSQKPSPGYTAPHSCCGLGVARRDREEADCCAPGSLINPAGKRSPGLGSQWERLRNEARKGQLVAVELELAGQRGRARVRVLERQEHLNLRVYVGLVMKPAQLTEPLRQIQKDSGLADDIHVPCQ